MSAKKEDAPVKMSLLEQSRQLSPVQNYNISPEYREEAEVCVAWIMGEIDTSAACRVLNLTNQGSLRSRVGTVLRNCAQAGALSITWKT
jgi:hypothetical protein